MTVIQTDSLVRPRYSTRYSTEGLKGRQSFRSQRLCNKSI